MEIKPVHYKLLLEPDFSTFKFKGEVELTVNTLRKTKSFFLHAHELSIGSVLCKRIENWEKAKFSLDLKKQRLNVDFISDLSDEFILKISYTGKINDQLAGFYRSEYKVNGETKYAAVTQFQESDARRAFPCLDEPGKKSRFEISFLVPEDKFCISNMEIVSEEIQESSKKLVKFATTPVMSTYLLFFGIGEFEYLETQLGSTNVRVIGSPDVAKKYGQFGLDFGIKSLSFCEEYFRVKYPLSKLDLIGTPAFAHGAMENWGAILFRENLLFHYPKVTSKAQETIIEEVIAHEIIHQWFGNLVSPINWKYLWLNESFATYFSYIIINHYYPEKKIWELFLDNQTVNALEADGKQNTMPIEVPGAGEVGMTITNAPILYDKGGSILRQISEFLGEATFQDGMELYFKKYAYDVASSEDLWRCLEEASNVSVSKMMKSWVLQEGYPIITVSIKGRQLFASQQRFTYLNIKSEATWVIPISVRIFSSDGKSRIAKILLKDKEQKFELEEQVSTYFVNANASGFFRVQYLDRDYQMLFKMIKHKQISAKERLIIENDAFARLKAKSVTLDWYLGLLENFIAEENYLVLNSISKHLNYLFYTLSGEKKKQVAKFGKMITENTIKTIGFYPKQNESLNNTIIRPKLLELASTLGSSEINEQVTDLFYQMKAGSDVSEDLLGSVYRISASQTNDYDYFVDLLENSENEQKIVLLTSAIASFSDSECIEKAKMLVFSKIPLRNRITVISYLFRNINARDSLWKWFIANLDNFEALSPYMYQLTITQLIPASKKHKDDMEEFFSNYIKNRPLAAEASKIGFEYLKIATNLSED